MNKCTVKQMCTKCMVQNADNQNCWCQLRCRLNVSSEFASATSCGRAFQAGLVRGRNAYLNMSTTDGKRWNCVDGIPVELQPARLWSCTSWSVCCGVYESAGVPIRDQTPTIADTETGGLLRRKGMFFTNRAARRWIISSLSIYFCWYGSQMLEQYSSLGRTIACKSFPSSVEDTYTKYVWESPSCGLRQRWFD